MFGVRGQGGTHPMHSTTLRYVRWTGLMLNDIYGWIFLFLGVGEAVGIVVLIWASITGRF
jgi:hypothetical protein